MATKLRIPEDVYLDTPDTEAPYHEYVDGEVIRKAMPDAFHMVLVQIFAEALSVYRKLYGGLCGTEGRTQFVREFDAHDYRLPDYAYWTERQTQTVSVRGRLYLLPPTLAIEVRSPEETMRSQRDKCRYYRSHGVPVAWLVDPVSRTVEVFEDGQDGTVLREGAMLTTSRLPGFELPVAELFGSIDALRPSEG